MPSPDQLLARLISVTGITGSEEEILIATAVICRELSLDAKYTEDGIVFRIEGKSDGPTLLACSHLDTVPAGEGWTVPPHTATINDGHIFGRGAVDARGSCLSIMLAAKKLATQGNFVGQFLGVLSVGEEGNDPSLPRLLEDIGPVDAAIVGEPTNMDIATAQRGLIVLELESRGVQGHAARTEGPNAALNLAQDLVHLNELQLPRWHQTLNQIKITPTRMTAGIADNLTPPVATALIDVRTTPSYGHDELIDLVSRAVSAEVKIVADQWIPCEIPNNHPFVTVAQKALPESKLFASDATSDWVFLEKQGIPAVKIGPGNPLYSHVPNERISLNELEAGIEGYYRLADTYLTQKGQDHA